MRQVAVRASPFASEVGTVCVMWPPELCGVQPAMQSIFGPASRRNLEDALARHPKLRIYLMHAGWPFLADTKAILQLYPQVYVDLASFAFNPGIPRAEFYGYLQELLRARDVVTSKARMRDAPFSYKVHFRCKVLDTLEGSAL